MPDHDPLLEPTPPAPKLPPVVSEGATKLCLLILFNHRYEANLPKLDQIYRARFAHVRYLIPFYRGERLDVIPTHYSSFQFQGFFREAWQRLKGDGFTHFLVVADDMILNPTLTDQNFLTSLGLGPETGYFKGMSTLADRSLEWSATASGLVVVAGKNGTNWQSELPPPEVAAANLEAKGYPMRRLGWQTLRGGLRAKGFFQFSFYLALRLVKRRRDPSTDLRALPYPLLSGNADLMLIPAKYMEKFCFYCSVFAAMGLFVEIAAPTALGLACPNVSSEHDTGWIGDDYFLGFGDSAKCDEFARQLGYRLENLFAHFGPRTLSKHPVKLSQWTVA